MDVNCWSLLAAFYMRVSPCSVAIAMTDMAYLDCRDPSLIPGVTHRALLRRTVHIIQI